MGMLGNKPAAGFQSIEKQTITGNGGTSYALDHAVTNVNDLEVFVNNVRQEPTTAYTISGQNIVMSEAIANTDSFYVIYQSRAFTKAVPADTSITSAMIQDNSITSTKLNLNKEGSDGDIALFRKDGTTVGSIGVDNSNNLFISGSASNHAGLEFDANAIYPQRVGVASDGTVDIGANGIAFKDLYLGGGAYIGGTGTANKLDDYEEGTFTGGIEGYYGNPSTAVTSTGYYTKIGNTISFWIMFDNVDTTGGSGHMWMTGLPLASNGPYAVQTVQMSYAGTFGTNSGPFGLVSGTILYFYYHQNQSNTPAVFHNAGTGRYIRCSGTYRVA